ncbi:hypothetical protein POJ06DRAFT_101618 [Lipomyces tetrasporus]|uniref:Secreted protein n=1 Tax=Lipomyces tetrasporus TaxID=54092 RepID=A0AAD7QS29_9ASCO|nr:uncharacterized protein POJ06DRAFT_101618 [Lipomyces tetrasporus]KAJ8100320.1 hypothetical protein POJ06DRAFT_101618 [Lipomyces tetrasporus]
MHYACFVLFFTFILLPVISISYCFIKYSSVEHTKPAQERLRPSLKTGRHHCPLTIHFTVSAIISQPVLFSAFKL